VLATKLVALLEPILLAIHAGRWYMNQKRINVPNYMAALEKNDQNQIDHYSPS
jgi:hypothetical protein